jgi:hypothetical protein
MRSGRIPLTFLVCVLLLLSGCLYAATPETVLPPTATVLPATSTATENTTVYMPTFPSLHGITPMATVVPTPIVINVPQPANVPDPNMACLLHGTAASSERFLIYSFRDLNKVSALALSCLDQDGWHVYAVDASSGTLPGASWLTHLPRRPWSNSLTPLQFPGWFVQCPDGNSYLFAGDGFTDANLYRLSGESMLEIGHELVPGEFPLGCGAGNELWRGGSDFDGSTWIKHPVELGNVLSSSVAPNGDVWALLSGGIGRFDGTNWQLFKEGRDYQGKVSPESLALDKNGTVWVIYTADGGNYYGLLKYDGATWSTFQVPEYGAHISNLTFDNDNNIWVIKDRQICRFNPQDNSWTPQFVDQEFFSIRDGGLQFDRQDRLWVVSGYGVHIYDGGDWSHYYMHNADLFSNLADGLLIFGQGPALVTPMEKAPGSVSGKLANPDPSVFAGMRVEICGGTVVYQYIGESPCAGNPAQQQVTVDAAGNFSFSAVQVGKYTLVIEINSTTWANMGEIEITPGSTLNLGEISYPPELKN